MPFLPLLLFLAAPAEGGPPERVSTLVVYGDDPCPKAESADEIVVCARQPESERYRVPKRFRDSRKPVASQLSWSRTVEALEWTGRDGTPNSCSPVGSGGQTGCYRQFLRQAREERRLMEQEAAEVP